MSGRRRTPEPSAVAPEDSVLLSTEDPVAPGGGGEFFGEGGAEDRFVVGSAPAAAVVTPPEEEEAVSLSPEEEIMFASLMTCGRRSKTVHLLNHTVVVESLNGDDDLRIGLYVKEYQGSLGEQRAYQIAVAAAGIRSIDGKPIATSLYAEAGNDALFDEKVAKVSKMYPTVINRIYRAVLDAEKEFVELATKLGKLDG